MKQRVKLGQALVHDPAFRLPGRADRGPRSGGRGEMLELVRKRTASSASASSSPRTYGRRRAHLRPDHRPGGRHVLRTGEVAAFTQETETVFIEVDSNLEPSRPRSSAGARARTWTGRVSRSKRPEATTSCARRGRRVGCVDVAPRRTPGLPTVRPVRAVELDGGAGGHATEERAAVFDMGYQPYTGEREGRGSDGARSGATGCARAGLGAEPAPRSRPGSSSACCRHRPRHG